MPNWHSGDCTNLVSWYTNIGGSSPSFGSIKGCMIVTFMILLRIIVQNLNNINMTLENWLRNRLHENEEMHQYCIATDTVRCWIEAHKNLPILENLRSNINGQETLSMLPPLTDVKKAAENYRSSTSNKMFIEEKAFIEGVVYLRNLLLTKNRGKI